MVNLTLFAQRIPVPPLRWLLVLYVLVLLGLAGANARGADDPDRDRKARLSLALAPVGKSSSDRDRDARVALALSEYPVALAVAPQPKSKDKPGLCSCGPNCPCGDTCPACPSAKPTGRAERNRIRDALVRVRQENGQGSGTVIWSEGGRSVVLTAAHVVEGAAGVTVRGEGQTYPARVLAQDPAADLAALLVEAELPAIAVSDADPSDGAEVLMFGLTSLWSKGTIKGRERLEWGDRYLLAYDSDSGDSGGGVFYRGELVGVHCGKCGPTRETATTPYCTSAKPVRSFLARVFRRDGKKLVPVEPATVKPARPATAKPDEYDTWLINGQFVRVPKGQRPNFAAPCPNGRCPLK
jgi:S1-C subfamily serine protease